MPIANDQPCFATQRRDRVNSRRIALRSKDDSASVGRNIRFMIIGWIVSETARFTMLAEDGGLGVRAYIFADRASDLAKEEVIPSTRILGYLMAHEIGHLLMGTNSHSRQGIMKGNWRRKEVKDALSGRLTFTSQECSRLRSAIEHRRKHAASRYSR